MRVSAVCATHRRIIIMSFPSVADLSVDTRDDLLKAREHATRIAHNLNLRFFTMNAVCQGVWDLNVLMLVNRMCDCITITYLEDPQVEFEIGVNKFKIEILNVFIESPARYLLDASELEKTDENLALARSLIKTLVHICPRLVNM